MCVFTSNLLFWGHAIAIITRCTFLQNVYVLNTAFYRTQQLYFHTASIFHNKNKTGQMIIYM